MSNFVRDADECVTALVQALETIDPPLDVFEGILRIIAGFLPYGEQNGTTWLRFFVLVVIASLYSPCLSPLWCRQQQPVVLYLVRRWYDGYANRKTRQLCLHRCITTLCRRFVAFFCEFPASPVFAVLHPRLVALAVGGTREMTFRVEQRAHYPSSYGFGIVPATNVSDKGSASAEGYVYFASGHYHARSVWHPTKNFRVMFDTGDVVTVRVDLDTCHVVFLKNGEAVAAPQKFARHDEYYYFAFEAGEGAATIVEKD